jgi:hypothetical protein
LLVAVGCVLLAGCNTTADVNPRRILPTTPDFAMPVGVPVPAKGESAVAVAARERAGRVAANRRIIAFREWYEAVRKAYSD